MTVLHTHELAALADALAALAPAAVRTGARPIDEADQAQLRAVEAASVARAVPKRRAEFASGRALLRSLLAVDDDLPVGADRAPVLPLGRVASLAHCDGVAVAVVGATSDVAALGVDVEPASPLTAEMARAILRTDDPEIDAHLAFTLKEAVYKAWSRLGGGLLDHHDVRLAMGDGDTFSGHVLPGDLTLEGRWTQAAGHQLALVVVPPGLRRCADTYLRPVQEAV